MPFCFQDEFLVTFEPNSWCTAQEMSAPCDENNSRVMRYGLRIVAMETKHIECCWRKRWLMSNNQGEKTPNTACVFVTVDVAHVSSGLYIMYSVTGSVGAPMWGGRHIFFCVSPQGFCERRTSKHMVLTIEVIPHLSV